MNARATLAGFIAVLASGVSAEAASLQPIGSTVQVVNLVTAEYNRDTRSLQRGDRVHQDETIEVGLDGSSELKLDDDTKLALGPGSHLKLDTFVYNPNKSNGSIVLDLVKGTFRFITGVAAKPTYVIKTPAAAITVRGTIFDVFVQPNGPTWVLLHEGAVQVRSTGGACKDLYEPGKLIRIDNDGGVGAPVRWASLSGRNAVPFNDAFPFVAKSPSIDPDPVLTRDVIMTGTLPAGTRPKGGDTCDDKPDTLEPVPSKPTKKKAKPTYEEKPKYERIKKRKKPEYKERKERADNDTFKKAVGVAVGAGIIYGISKHKPGGYGGGGYGGGRGGGRGMGGGSGYGR